MTQREIIPALTPDEGREADRVFRHAARLTEKHGVVSPRKRALVVVKCNQLASDNASMCDWSESIETNVLDAERKGRAAIAQHLATAHPYLTSDGRRSLVGNAWVNLRDFSLTGG